MAALQSRVKTESEAARASARESERECVLVGGREGEGDKIVELQVLLDAAVERERVGEREREREKERERERGERTSEREREGDREGAREREREGERSEGGGGGERVTQYEEERAREREGEGVRTNKCEVECETVRQRVERNEAVVEAGEEERGSSRVVCPWRGGGGER